jgi:cytolysin-activating lysine-acyltransferase
MQHGNLIMTAPALHASGHSEAEVFGSVVWLWMNAKSQCDMPLHALSLWLLPALKSQQFVLASQRDGDRVTPVAYLAWAKLTAEAESRYVDNPATGLLAQDWQQGDRMWITDFFCPFGHAREFANAVSALLPHSCFRSFYHRGGERGMRILYFRGDQVSRDQAKQWWKDRPILALRANQLKEETHQISS